MNPTEAKFHEDLDAIADQLDLDVKSGKYSWADVRERFKDRTTEVAQTTDRYVHEYAWTSLGVAGVLGIFLGLILSRR
jgi:ElaB/YqjD/DUF883 family membrane-anchored ribosome-binding protein